MGGKKNRFPVVRLSPSKTVVGKPVSAKVAFFSSRGPNSVAPAILKVYDIKKRKKHSVK